ncbi:MAG: glycoside hydrolase family 15 protein [Steroidobacteraceae bacterium]
MPDALQAWLATQYAHSRIQMLRSISRTDLVKLRPGFGQQVRAASGSVLASPVLADWDPEPDYFFHWFRDSSLVIDALRLLYEDGQVGDEALVMLAEFIGFSRALRDLDGRRLPQLPRWRDEVRQDFRQYLRDEPELAAVRGERVIAETRVNADGTLDISKWTRPQHDGAPLRALTLLRWRPHVHDAALTQTLAQLLRDDLAFVLAHWSEPAFDMWEEDQGLHYHTLAVSAAALQAGAAWYEAEGGDAQAAQHCRRTAQQIRARLDAFWLPAAHCYAAHETAAGADPDKALDISVVFAAIHGWDGSAGRHTAGDPRLHATLQRLMTLFAEQYAINRDRRDGPAMGRYQADRYFSGGAYYFSTFAAAELCFRAAALAAGADVGARAEGSAAAREWCVRGDAFLATVQAFTPASGDLSEQFDQHTGAQTSARHLAWSYAAFISCLAARRSAWAAVNGP